MRWLVHSIPLLALLIASCNTTNNTTVVNPVEPTNTPTITGFSPDTVWTFDTLTIRGTNFGYDPAYLRITIDTALAQITDDEDTIVKVVVPEGARSGFIHAWAYEQTGTSKSQVVVKYTFHPDSLNDSIPTGTSFSIRGTGLNNYRGSLRLYVNGIIFPIDSILPHKIVSHVIANATTGTIAIYDATRADTLGTLTVTRLCAWTTLSEIWDNLTVRETHTRTGYVNSNPIDSTWQKTVTFSRQIDTTLSGTVFSKKGYLDYTLIQPGQDPTSYYPLLHLLWDTANQTANIGFTKISYLPTSLYEHGDTEWSRYTFGGGSVPAPLPVDGDIEFTIPSSGFSYSITVDSSDSQGLTNWQETTSGTIISGAFDLILKH